MRRWLTSSSGSGWLASLLFVVSTSVDAMMDMSVTRLTSVGWGKLLKAHKESKGYFSAPSPKHIHQIQHIHKVKCISHATFAVCLPPNSAFTQSKEYFSPLRGAHPPNSAFTQSKVHFSPPSRVSRQVPSKYTTNSNHNSDLRKEHVAFGL